MVLVVLVMVEKQLELELEQEGGGGATRSHEMNSSGGVVLQTQLHVKQMGCANQR